MTAGATDDAADHVIRQSVRVRGMTGWRRSSRHRIRGSWPIPVIGGAMAHRPAIPGDERDDRGGTAPRERRPSDLALCDGRLDT